MGDRIKVNFKPMPDSEKAQTIAISFDGTGNEPSDAGRFTRDESISNVLKLHILMGGGLIGGRSDTTTPSGEQQRTFYYSGIGTLGRNQVSTRLGQIYIRGRSPVNMAVAPRWGDAGRILADARKDFLATYRPGDRVLVLGFSRGAALARKFVCQILEAEECEEIAFLGVFDTVAALDGVHQSRERISTDVVFESGTLHERIFYAVHVLALDETRIPFTPTQINKDIERPERILEVWFPGVHSDIGGGYWLDGLSDLTLEFMVGECKKILGDHIRIHDGDQRSLQNLLHARGDFLPGIEADDLLIHPMIHGALHAHSGLAVRVGKEKPRRVCVRDRDEASEDPEDLPIIHHSVSQRFKLVSGYRPHSLRGLKFRLMLPDGSISREYIRGIGGLLNYP